MSNLKPQQPSDEDIERRIAIDDRVAHQLYHNSQLSDANSELDGALAAAFGDLGEETEAELALTSQEHDLIESRRNKELALARLIDEKMLIHMRTPPEDPKWFAARLPEVRTAVTTLFTAARDATHSAGDDGWAVARAYRQFIDLTAQPVTSRETVVAALRSLQSFLELVKPIAGSDDQVRGVWLHEAGVIANNL
ncbi:MAG TPA: hypothetical protein VF808_13935 [Ktedonobacterales bacterium]